MSFLSNWRSDRNSAAPHAVTCRPARQDEIYPALRLVLATGPHRAPESQVADFLRYALSRGIDVSALVLAEQDGEILYAALPVPSPGRTLLLLAPGHLPGPAQASAAGQLLDQLSIDYAAREFHLAQVLLDPTEQDAIALFSDHAFMHLAELLYLQTTVRRATTLPALPPGHSWTTYSPEVHADFARAIAATYQQSLDCPALAGLRDIEDIVAGHRATGEFRPELWFLLRHGNEPRGVVLLAPAPPSDSMELVYLGLPPASRGQGVGDLLMRQAAAATHAFGLCRLTLAVDSTNAPALRLYYRHGLRTIASKVALMRDLRRTAPPPTP